MKILTFFTYRDTSYLISGLLRGLVNRIQLRGLQGQEYLQILGRKDTLKPLKFVIYIEDKYIYIEGCI